MINYIMFGAPGVGKGTLAEIIAKNSGAIHISTGDIFRKNIKGETELGKQVKEILDAGNYVPDSLTNEILLDAIEQPEAQANGYILDGYPRTVEQVRYLAEHLSKGTVTKVIILEADQDKVVERLLARGRADDTEATIAHRYEVFLKETAPLVDEYEHSPDKGVEVIHQNSTGEILEIWEELKTKLGL